MVNKNKFFCRGCGKSIHQEAEICPRCGVRQHNQIKNKSKTTAVLLAIFLAPFNWLYTYKKDSLKFWIGLIFEVLFWISFNPILFMIGIGVWIWAIIDTSTKETDWYDKF